MAVECYNVILESVSEVVEVLAHYTTKGKKKKKLYILRSNHGIRQRAKIGLALFVYYQNLRYKQKVSEEGVRKN